ncbi:hypothetical protein D1007_05149 [Hordeum vulgare]|nr:hypothetical protein D1007_05149 [Hordeum vulgare]
MFGWKKADGAYIVLTGVQTMKFSPLLAYNQELGQYIKNLQMDLLEALFEKEALHQDLKAEKLKVSKQEQGLGLYKICQELKDSHAMTQAKDIQIQKLKNQLLELQGRQRKLRINKDDLAEELEKIKHDQNKIIEDEDMDKIA